MRFWLRVSRGVGAARLAAGNVKGVPLWLPELVERRRRCRDDGQQFLLVTTTRLAQLFCFQNRQALEVQRFLVGLHSRRSLATLAQIHSVGNTWLIRDEANSMEHTTGLLVVHRSLDSLRAFGYALGCTGEGMCQQDLAAGRVHVRCVPMHASMASHRHRPVLLHTRPYTLYK